MPKSPDITSPNWVKAARDFYQQKAAQDYATGDLMSRIRAAVDQAITFEAKRGNVK